jgi:hypothetical protein
MPGYDAISNHYLRWFAPGLRLFGSLWFTPRSIYMEFRDKAIKSYQARNLNTESPVLFVGINMRGILAKNLAMRTGRHGIAFVSMPLSTEFYTTENEENARSAMFIKKVFNRGGLFGIEALHAGANYAIPGDPNLAKWDNTYASFCNLAESCGYHDQFSEYCTAVIGADKLAEIREYLDVK